MRRHVTVRSHLAFVLAAALLGATAGMAAELPAQSAQSKKPKQAEQPVKHCDIAGSPGILAANGVCVRLSGYISSGFSAGQLK
jgi:hypothetical protein